MQLGKELATGFVADDAQARADAEAGQPPDGADARAPVAPEAPALPAQEPEQAAAG
jgi:hypothetical protein